MFLRWRYRVKVKGKVLLIVACAAAPPTAMRLWITLPAGCPPMPSAVQFVTQGWRPQAEMNEVRPRHKAPQPMDSRMPNLNASKPLRHLNQGFTLVELMVVVAIISILAMVGIPSYRDYVVRGQLADAATGLASVRANMERHFQDNRSYATVGTFVTPCDSTIPVTARTFGSFVVSCSGTPTATAFTLQAVGSNAVAGFTYTINQQDVRQTTAAPSGWPTCTSQWMMKKGQSC
jgi:type IV pilus assembly protein PilE